MNLDAAPPQAVIRTMVAADLDAVLALEQSTPEAPHWARADYERFLDLDVPPDGGADSPSALRRVGLVAELNGRVRGFAIVRNLRLASEGAPEMLSELESIVVDRALRLKGLGTRLMEAVLDLAIRDGANRLELEVRASNQAASRLYAHAGLQVQGRRPAYYSNPEEDAVLMAVGLPRASDPKTVRVTSVSTAVGNSLQNHPKSP
jgi:ribosomal-protein-alanine N-acetyltransferase